MGMTKLLDQALEVVTKLSPDEQDEIARAMLDLAAENGEPEAVDAAHLPAILRALTQTREGQFATDEEIDAAFNRFDR